MLKFSEVVQKLKDYYLNFIDEDSLETEFTIPAEHTMVCISIGLYVGWGCILNCLCYHPYLVSMLFADLLSLHLVTCLIYFIVIDSCDYSRGSSLLFSSHILG